MASILLCEIDRPGLVAALASRGLSVGEVVDRDAAAMLAPAFAICLAPAPFPGCGQLVVLAADEAAAIAALDGGADDAILAGTSDALIAARLARMLGRDRFAVGALVLDTVARRASLAGRVLALLPREYALLLHFARAAGRVVTRGELREALWGQDFDPGTNVIEVHVSRLRAKLARAATAPLLLTDKGRGYRLVEGAPIAGREIAL